MPVDATDTSTTFPDGGTSTSSANRSDMVEAARQFMSTPKVRNTPFDEQKKFLLEKGVTESEIEAALKQLPPMPDASAGGMPLSYHPQQQMYYQPPPPTFGGKLYSFTQSMVVIGGASYMAYKMMRTWVLPKFFNIPDSANDQFEHLQTQVNELQNSTKFIMDSVEETFQTVSAQREQLKQALLPQNNASKLSADINRIQEDLSTVKSLLLNKNQFPAVPSSTPPLQPLTQSNGVLKQPKTVRWQTNSIPSWQLTNGSPANNTSEAAANNTIIENGLSNEKENGEEKYDDDEFVEAQNDSV